MKKNVAIVAYPSGHGGIETVLEYVLKNKQINDAFDLSLFCFSKLEFPEWKDKLSDLNVNFTNFKSMIFNMTRYIKFLIGFSGSALIILNPVQIYIAAMIKKIFKKKYIIISWVHSSIAEPGVGEKVGMIKKADYYLAISTGIKKEYENNGFEKSKIKTIFNPIHREKQTILPNKNHCVFIYVGRIVLDGQKNFRGILNALKDNNGDWEFHVYGSGNDEYEAKKIVESNSNLKSKIKFMGWSNSPWDKIVNADALLMNSNYEGFPMVLAEAISRGLPCISTNCPTGPDDLIKPKVNGFLYDVGNYSDLKKYLNLLVTNSINFDENKVKKTLDTYYDPMYTKRFIKSIGLFIN